MNVRLGIMGAGQLGMYLCEAAARLGVQTCVLTPDASAPACHKADKTIVGALDHAPTVELFIEHCDIITFELEDIPNETLNQLILAERDGQVRVNPGVDTLFMLKDKGLQKAWLRQHGFPHLPHMLLNGFTTDPMTSAHDLGFPVVQKARCGGYDGRGVQVIESATDIDRLWDTPSILEAYLDERREISVLCARNTEGQLESYPPVSMEFNNSLNALSLVYSPAGISEEIATQATRIAEDIVNTLEGVGLFAIEMFVSPDGDVLVNEISPRVHNSGHITLEACSASQFEQHIRAVLGLPLAQVESLAPASMVNILYEDALAPSCPNRPATYQRDDVPAIVHWYGKTPGRVGRKMGHITVLDRNPEAAAWQANAALVSLSQPRGDYAA